MRSMQQARRHAVALRYDQEKDAAPCVLAKGSGFIAEQIVQAAQAQGIPLIHDPVAGDLLRRVDLGAEIPPEFYRAVAEILAFVYRLNETAGTAEDRS